MTIEFKFQKFSFIISKINDFSQLLYVFQKKFCNQKNNWHYLAARCLCGLGEGLRAAKEIFARSIVGVMPVALP